MDKHFSLYLDLVRFTAALLVVLSHLVQDGLVGDIQQDPMLNFGREGVIVFFLLSGFVIAYTTSDNKATLREYIVARCARIYSVVLPVLLATMVVVFIAVGWFGASVNAYQLAKPELYLPLHLLFMGEMWNLSETPPWLVQYWSLGYEVWYYVLFGVAFFLRGAARLALGTAVLLIMGHKLWLLLPIWLAGAWLYQYQKDWPLSRWQARAGCVATIALLCVYKYYGADIYLRELGNALWPFASLTLGSADRYLADYTVCVLIYLHFLFARQAALSELAVLANPIRALASYTFTLYLIHGPVMGIWAHFNDSASASALDVLALCGWIALATYGFGYVTERRKNWFKQLFDSLYMHTARRFA